MTDSRDLKDAGSVRSGPLSHVPSATALFPIPTYPGGLLSRPQNTQPHSRNTHGISGNIFANSPVYSSAPFSRSSSSWEETAAGRILMHEGAEKPVAGVSEQSRDTIPTPRFLRSSSAGNSFFPREGRNYRNYGADQQRFKSRNSTLTGSQLHKRFRTGR